MSNRTDIVVETDNAEGQVLLSASRVYDLTEDKTQDTINSEIKNTLNQLDSNKADKSAAVSNITRSGTTFTATKADGTTFTFDQQDTNTWRGIQNNLTSTSTTDSLSAAQGKALNDKIAGKIGSFTVNVAGQTITISDIGGYYGTKSISSSVPSGATLIGVKWETSGFDGGISVMLLQNATLVFNSAKSCTLASNRTLRVFYYK